VPCALWLEGSSSVPLVSAPSGWIAVGQPVSGLVLLLVVTYDAKFQLFVTQQNISCVGCCKYSVCSSCRVL